MQTIGNAGEGGTTAAPSVAAAPRAYDSFEYVCKFCFKTFKSEYALRGHQNLRLAPASPKPTLVKPISVRVYANGDGVAIELGNGKAAPDMDFLPELAMSASADLDGETVSDEGSVSDWDSIEVDSDWELDLDLKL